MEVSESLNYQFLSTTKFYGLSNQKFVSPRKRGMGVKYIRLFNLSQLSGGYIGG